MREKEQEQEETLMWQRKKGKNHTQEVKNKPKKSKEIIIGLKVVILQISIIIRINKEQAQDFTVVQIYNYKHYQDTTIKGRRYLFGNYRKIFVPTEF